jgi:adenylate cyclase
MMRKTISCVVMFADIADSTTIYENMGDELARERILNALNTLIAITQSNKGHLVKTIGDEILVYFTDVDLALLAAHRIQEVMEDDQNSETKGVSIRIGMQFGSVILETNDIFGDTVNVAARIASMAKARQILCTKEMACLVKNNAISASMRPFDRITVRGKSEPLDIYLFSWEEESDVTNMAPLSSFTNLTGQKQCEKLTLTYRNKRYEIAVSNTSYILGRGSDCDLVVDGDLISRHHSKLEHRRGKFVITDQSTNGTFIKTQEGQAVFLRREELTLFGVGFISLGKKVDLNDDDIIQFYSE